MREFQLLGRSAFYAENGMVATSHPEAARIAVVVLRAGGNAVDAAVAASFALAVAEPHMTGIGGDCFALYAPEGGPLVALNGSGRAPNAVTVERLLGLGVHTIEPRSAHAVTVPGAVDAWCRLATDYGKRPLDELIAPAIDLAERGTVVQPRVAFDWAAHGDRLSSDDGASRTFLPFGAPPAPGDRHQQPLLAATLRRIARLGRDGFYRGPVAEDMVDHLRSRGGLHSLLDFAEQRSEYVAPIHVEYKDHCVYECPPNGQGLAALMMLRILSGLELERSNMSPGDRVHVLTEATKLVYRERDALLGEPSGMPVQADELLSERRAARLRERIQLDAILEPGVWDEREHRDTVYLCVVDRDRNAISIISSLFDAFGSGLFAPRSGVLLQNRGGGFRVAADHPNGIAPGKRPLHTIIPGMLVRDGRAVMPFGVTGGHYQPVGHAHLLHQILDRGMDIQQAIEEPRSFLDGAVLTLEARHDPAIFEACSRKGHRVAWAPRSIGCAQAIWIDHGRGALIGGSDPRADGLAWGF